jgi:hypothetical protein
VPLLDHFNPPLSRTHPWRAFHGAWAAAMARLLNRGVLPPGYYAVPFVDADGPVEIDVAALRDDIPADGSGPWSPEAPAMAVAIDPPATGSARVDVLTNDGDPQLAAAVELVSPRNKDRASARRAFAAKCVGYLERGAGLVVVDPVTTRRGDLHAELLEALGAVEVSTAAAGPSATAYRSVPAGKGAELQIWPSLLVVGRALPTLPLWISPDLAVPLDLEASHTAACEDIRIRPAG